MKRCPKCGDPLRIFEDANGEYLRCTRRTCSHREPLPEAIRLARQKAPLLPGIEDTR